jgi:aspartyl-tRNA(Asn)/glutamyl-tRNA(Gln) amidotransferase subunit A
VTTDLPTIEEAAARLRAGDVTAVELATRSLEQIEREQETINAFITITPDVALEQADQADRELAAGRDRGPLTGLPIGIKDLFDTNGIRTTCASKLLADHVPDRDAAVVARLRAAGAVLMGKLNMDEFAFGPHQEWFGRTNNPYDLTRTAGGSSGGAGAAVATGAVFGAVGTDTGGSIRMPASFCGVVGLKPTHGRVSLEGVHKIAWSMDHAGPFGRTVRDARAMFDAIVDQRGSASLPIAEPPTLAVLRRAVDDATPGVRSAVEAALNGLERAGARIVEAREIHGIDQHLAAFMITIIGEGSLGFEELLRDSADGISPKIRANLELGSELRAADYLRAQRYRTMLRESVSAALEGVDAIVTPTMQREPWTWEELDALEELVIFGYTAPFSLTGNPALSVPVPSEGLPVGLQLVGHHGEDERLFDLAEWLEGRLSPRSPAP